MGLIFGDCLDVLATLEPGSISACITDPPYGIGAPGTDDWDAAIPTGAVWSAVRRVLRPGAAIAVMTARSRYHHVTRVLEDHGYTVRDMLVWLYSTGRAAGRHRLRAAHDPIALAVAGTGPLRLDVEAGRIPVEGVVRGRWPTTVAHDGSTAVIESLPRVPASHRQDRDRLAAYGPASERGGLAGRKWNETPRAIRGYGEPAGSAARYFFCARASASRRHPTEKPLALMRWLVRLLCRPGGVVLDPYMGGGSTCLAAEMEGRGYIGIERDPRYHAAASAALQAEVGGTLVRGTNARQD